MKPQTPWITIQEHGSSPQKTPVAAQASGVHYKWLWGAGFFLVLAVSAGMLAPKQLASVLQGNLFETNPPASDQQFPSLEIVGDKIDPQSGAGVVAPADTTPSSDVSAPVAPSSTPVVQPQDEPVAIQLTPIAETPPASANAPAGAPAVPPITPPADANQALLNQLNQQLETAKKEPVLYPAAPEAAPVPVTVAQPTVAATPPASANAPAGTPPAITSGGYKPNTHLVATPPQVVLQQNLMRAPGRTSGGTAVPAGTASSVTVPRTGKTPESGPENILIAFAATFAALVIWKGHRIFRRA